VGEIISGCNYGRLFESHRSTGSKQFYRGFAYTSGDSFNPKPSSDQDGIFFFDNKFAIESWANSIRKKPVLNANSDQIYACLGIPKIYISQDSSLRFGWSGTGQRPASQIMMSDAFNRNKHGLGENGQASFRATFGENTAFFISQGKEE
jgi:hypothetical protein